MRELDREAILDLFTELGSRLCEKGVEAEFYVVGGAAMLLAYGREKMTRDIDAIFEPKTAVYEVARTMAREKGWLDQDWLNDGVKGFIRGPDPGKPKVIFASSGISIQVASPQRLRARHRRHHHACSDCGRTLGRGGARYRPRRVRQPP